MEFNIDMFFMCLFIFLARISDVTFMSIRTILLTKGMSKLAAFMGFFEVTIYIIVLGKVVNSLDNPFYLISYALGYAAGNFIGSKIESFLAFGDAQMRIVLPSSQYSVVDDLRGMGYGVTVFRGEGKDGERIMLMINLKRKQIGNIYDYIKAKEIKAFVSTNDITSYAGGYHNVNKKNNLLRKLKR
ncbi:hypothetical protein HMPREF9630_01139 [Peptoanaerobacter stomatis]|uniref:UPF0316 protein HMPREF9630_01139 n=1 Tax=Peptoanaerobacter stomatis TaxID=796937 RepID=V9HV10_9FIRM|nr:DUF5698 domain-containing protein [Peptoanaerobacter stomatis]EHL18144.1 hypothetical protein HMPREF9630_01139 [Peptoanaerobacter stomatis]